MQKLLEKDSKFIWHPYTSLNHKWPKTVFEKASGVYVYDSLGNAYIDATSSWWCNIHGHCNKRLINALTNQARLLDQVLFAPHTHSPAIELAETLIGLLNIGNGKVFFSDNGSTAVEVALKIALQYWNNQNLKKCLFVSLENSYHGDTFGAMSVSDVGIFKEPFQSMLINNIKIPCPTSEEEEDKCFFSAIKIIEENKNNIAAVIFEPLVLGAAGMKIYSTNYLEKVVKHCHEIGLLVIFDEVFTGFGRTGTLFAFQKINEKPDIICLSKALTGGMLPLGATIVTDFIFDTFRNKTLYHGHTYSANPISCSVALESIKIILEENIISKNEKIIKYMNKEEERFSKLPLINEVRQIGLIWAIEFKPNISDLVWLIASAAWEKGVWLRPLHNVIYVVPPYSITEYELGKVFNVLYESILSNV